MHSAAISFLDPQAIISAAGPWALLVIAAIVFSETGLLIGFILPGDSLLLIAGVLTNTTNVFGASIWIVCSVIALAAILGGEVGYTIGKNVGPRVFQREGGGLLSADSISRTNSFFERYGAVTVVIARFVPVVRTVAPVAAGVGKMSRRTYSLYNVAGALIWAFSVTGVGYLIGNIPPLADFIRSYIDLILIGAVLIAIVPTLSHYLRARAKAKIEKPRG